MRIANRLCISGEGGAFRISLAETDVRPRDYEKLEEIKVVLLGIYIKMYVHKYRKPFHP
ncbi:hypothetical protein [Paenibacillus sp. TAF43_2]|uniref:hypothetical protein n=1 Tax=Paenibacillus sp. TAF43_2 TaxID=3233069 RepID=UPI003F943C38